MRNVNWLGLAITVICVACSLGISAYQGFMTAENVVVGLLYGAVGVGAVLWECVGLHRIQHNRREGRPGAAVACAIGLIFATLLAISFDTDFLGTLFEGRASVGTAKAGKRETLETERAEAQKQIDKAGIVRPAVAIQGDLDAKAAIRADAEAAKAAGDDEAARKGCGDICKGHRKRYDELMTALNLPPSPAALAAEMGTARAVETARARIREIQAELAPLDKAGVADAKSTYIGYLTRWEDQDNRALVAFIIIFFLWCGRVFGPYVFMDPPAPPSPARLGEFEPITLAEKKPIPAAEYPAITGAASLADSPPADRPIAADMAEKPDDSLSAAELAAYLDMEESANEAEMIRELTAPSWADRPDQPEPAEEQLDLQATRIRRLVESFAGDCLTYNTDDATHREAAQVMQNAFQLWLTEKNIGETVSKMDFGMHMKRILERAGGAFVKAGNRYYVGAMLNPVWADKLGRAAPIVEPVREPMTDGRRLGRFLDRSGRPPLELEEPRGSA